MALLSAKYLYLMIISLFLTALSWWDIGQEPKKPDTFEKKMDSILAEQHVSLALIKMRVDAFVARKTRENTKSTSNERSDSQNTAK